MTNPHLGDTLFLPRGRDASSSRTGKTLPPHLQEQLPRRLRTVALLYALAYFLSALLPAILMGSMSKDFPSLFDWVVTFGSILAGLVVALIARSSRVSWQRKMQVGLLFEVLGSYGIALSMYTGAERFASTPIVFHALGPSWVAIWMIVYSIVVPAPPGRASTSSAVRWTVRRTRTSRPTPCPEGAVVTGKGRLDEPAFPFHNQISTLGQLARPVQSVHSRPDIRR